MKPVRFHPEAEAEMMSAAKFYETQQQYLGKRFLRPFGTLSTESKSILSYTTK
jgi:hypothetical protein